MIQNADVRPAPNRRLEGTAECYQVEDGDVAVRRSDLDPRVWVPYTLGFGDQSCFLNAGGLRAVKRFCERRYGVATWHKVSEDEWIGRPE